MSAWTKEREVEAGARCEAATEEIISEYLEHYDLPSEAARSHLEDCINSHARTDLPDAIAEIRRLRDINECLFQANRYGIDVTNQALAAKSEAEAEAQRLREELSQLRGAVVDFVGDCHAMRKRVYIHSGMDETPNTVVLAIPFDWFQKEATGRLVNAGVLERNAVHRSTT